MKLPLKRLLLASFASAALLWSNLGSFTSRNDSAVLPPSDSARFTAPAPLPLPTRSQSSQTLKPPTGANSSQERYWPGLPQTTHPVTILLNKGYATGYSTQVYSPLWTAYAIANIPKDEAKSEARPSAFFPNPAIAQTHQIETREYTSSGFDRGHMAPNWAISVSYGREAQLETFYTTNICPQRPECNRHLWEDLEKIEANDYARRYNGVVSYDGPIYHKTDTGIGHRERIKIPAAFYKIIVRQHKNEVDCIAFIIPQLPEATSRNSRDNLQKYIVSVSEVEKQTDIRFLNNLPEDLQKRLKAKTPSSLW